MNKNSRMFFLVGGALSIGIWLSAQEPTPATQGQPHSTMRRAMKWKRFDYTCEGGQNLVVYLQNQTAKVRYKDREYLMRQTRSADGNRYSDGTVVWWGKGNGGFLQEDHADGNGAMIVQDCKLNTPVKGEAGSVAVSGTVSYLQRMALPPSAMVIVQLQDSSLADAAAKVLPEDQITLSNRQVPIRFSLKYDPANIDERHTYTVSTRILVDGQLRFTTDKLYPVLTHGNGNEADLVLQPVSGSPSPRP